MTDFPIVTERLRKEYGDFTAVEGIDLEIKRNSFTGFLGPNGAGKSTTLKMLTGLVPPTSGKASVNGHDIAGEPIKALECVGAVVETAEFYPCVTPREIMRFFGEVFGMSRETTAAKTDEILEMAGMTEWIDTKIGTFSKGMKQRVAIGQALLNDPEVLILDEPTSGLDPKGMAGVRQVLRRIKAEKGNLTVLMGSHMLHDVEELCDRVAIIDRGKLLLHEDLSKISNPDGRKTVTLGMNGGAEELEKAVTGIGDVVKTVMTAEGLTVTFVGGRKTQAEIFSLAGGYGAYSLTEASCLESAYMATIKGVV